MNYALGFLVAGLVWSSILLTVSLLAWDAKGMIAFGLLVTVLGFAVKQLAENI